MALKPPFYVISDTHWFHDNIVKYADRPVDHDQIMIKRWQRAIKEGDTVLHLGDLFFGGRDAYERFRKEITPNLPGRKYIILGNHDKKWDYSALGFTVIDPFSILYRNYRVTFAHYPTLLDEERNERAFHIHGHIHQNGYATKPPYEYIPERWGNINVSVEVIDYRPVRVTRLINRAISARNQKAKYVNSRHFRYQTRARAKRAA